MRYRYANKTTALVSLTACTLIAAACQQPLISRTDSQVYDLVQKRQQAALGRTADTNIGRETGQIKTTRQMYRAVPGSAPAFLPEQINTTIRARQVEPESEPTSEPQPLEAETSNPPRPLDAGSDTVPTGPDISAPTTEPEAVADSSALTTDVFSDDERARLTTFGLSDAIGYAMKHARQLQNAKEDLYLAALDLTLERHLWTPQFVATVSSDFSDDITADPTERALNTVAEVSAEQRLPFGGKITAQVISTLVRELAQEVTTAESGQIILQAELPLFRGAGRVAYESRYQSERSLIYAVRTFERFRRSFAVQVSRSYFELQQFKAGIENAHKSYINRRRDWEKAEYTKELGQSQTIFDASRALASFRSAEASLVSAKEQYASALDRFKILIGMSVDEPLDVLHQDKDPYGPLVDNLCPAIGEETAVQVAIDYRLDLLTSRDEIDDARRGVVVAKNQILPDLNLTGGISFDPDDAHLDLTDYSDRRTTYSAGIRLQMDDRKQERNGYRRSLVTLRRSERNHEEFEDTVRADVRQALRRIDQQADLRAIQALSVEESETRTLAARAQYELDKVTILDLTDAEDELLAARNALAAAVAAYRNAILAFRLDTGTLWITDTGTWVGVEKVDVQLGNAPPSKG